jgi:hypothetical protein
MDIDPKTAEMARAKLHAFLDGNPPPEKAALAREALGMLPAPNMKPRNNADVVAEDEKLGIANKPVESHGALADQFAPGLSQEQQDEAAVSPKRPEELDNDFIGQEIGNGAMGTALMHGIGLALSKPARAILDSKGGRAAQLLKSTEAAGGDPGVFNPDAIVQGGSLKGQKAGDAIEHLQRLKANGADVERELESIYSDAHTASPDVEAARAALKFRPPSAYESVHALHGNPVALASAGTHVLPPIMGALTVPASIANATGAGIANVVSPTAAFLNSPIMQAVMGGQVVPLPLSPVPGGSR